jgi:hypothetical protein
MTRASLAVLVTALEHAARCVKGEAITREVHEAVEVGRRMLAEARRDEEDQP